MIKKRGRTTLLAMKITAIILLSACLAASARGFTQVSFSGTNVPLQKVFKEMKKQTGYNFLYNYELLQNAGPVSVKLNNLPIEKALNEVLKGKNLSYEIIDKTVVIREGGTIPKEEAATIRDEPATIDVRGRLVDENGDPVEGASVKVKGTSTGTTTNDNGEFSLRGVNEDAVLVFSGVNIEGFEKKAGPDMGTLSSRTRVISMQNVMVSKGYYSTTQRLNTGNVAIVKGPDLQKQPVTDPILALEGRVAGLDIQQSSGIPGAYSNIALRGQNTLPNGFGKLPTANDPLYIIDGVPFSSQSMTSTFIGGGALGNPVNVGKISPAYGLSPFNNLNMADIESIEILKDADATAIYGSRGANGVILITTKKGKAGQTKVDFNIYSGTEKITKKLDLLNTQQYLEMRHEAFRNDNKIPGITDYDINGTWDTTRYTDWQDMMIGNTAHFTNAQLSISGGNTTTQFYVGGGYSIHGVVFPGNYHDKKASALMGITHTSLNQRFHLQANANYVNDNNNLPDIDMTSQIVLAPDAPELYDANGNLNWQLKNGVNTWLNPLRYTLQNNKSVTNNLISSLNIGYKFFTGFELKANIGYSHAQLNQTNITPATTLAPQYQDPSNRSLTLGTTDNETWIIEPQASYQKEIKKGTLELLLGSTLQKDVSHMIAWGYSGFSTDELISNPAAAAASSLAGNRYSEYRYNALFGRVGYNCADKYLINFTGRRDGSSRFGPGRQFGNFGAIGIGWVFSKEQFVQDNLSFLSFGKLRISYGSTGNDKIGDYQYLSTYDVPTSQTYQSATVLNPTQLTNPDFAWERVKKFEAGIELGLVRDKINLSASYYRNRTDNQLVGYTLPYITGFASVQYNLPAVIQNTGWEFTLNTFNVNSKSFAWATYLNLSIPNNKLVSFEDFDNSGYKYSYTVGKPLAVVGYWYHAMGVNPQNGLYSFTTKNANGIPTAPDDYIVTKPITQHYYGGISNQFTYKNFQLDIFIQYVNKTALSYLRYFSMPGQFTGLTPNQPTYVLDRWQKPGDITEVQKFSTGMPSLRFFALERNQSDGVVTDASFARLKNVSLSYRLPTGFLKKAALQSARIYFQAQNLLTITNYKGIDPETASSGIGLPPLRTLTAGIQFTF